METEPIEGQPRSLFHGLETFLGGMETERIRHEALVSDVLETFLGGMETSGPWAIGLPPSSALKPSLVEWKPDEQKVHLREQLP